MFGVYVHWPFCLSKCPYCDFNSHVHDRIDHDAWAGAYLRETDHYAALTPGRTVETVFFGGGTPSLMKPQTVAAVLEHIKKRWKTAPDWEVTLEANPTSVEADKFKGFRDAGVNRVSLGVQALDDASLKALGRTHSAAEARKAVGIARDYFGRYNFDLIYARPKQTPQEWAQELRAALPQTNGHMSLYQLTIEPGTAFHTLHARGDLIIPDNDTAGDFYDVTQEIMDEAGMPAYEISNHARPGQESRHNLIYWRYGDYAGIGPGAHGRLTLDGKKQATRGHRAPDIWLKRVGEDGHGGHPFEEVSPGQQRDEAVMMGLRLKEGIELARFGLPADRVQRLENEGLARSENGRLMPTAAGMIRLDSILGYLLRG
jgi:oxygen-independent coproporphyrinogen-3 oxidase